jgi:hypothetical protein
MKTLTRLFVALCLVTLGACTGSDESAPATSTTGREVGLFGGWHPGRTDHPHPCARRYSYRAYYATLLNRESNTTPLP